MMYEYMTLSDDTVIAHSDMKKDGTVKVYVEKPVEGGFHHITCILPEYKWLDCEGFSDADVEEIKATIQNNAHLILDFSQQGGFANASGF